MFCFELKIKKKLSISSSMKKKIILRFTFTLFSIQNNFKKFNLKLTNLCRFDEWQLSATIDKGGKLDYQGVSKELIGITVHLTSTHLLHTFNVTCFISLNRRPMQK